LIGNTSATLVVLSPMQTPLGMQSCEQSIETKKSISTEHPESDGFSPMTFPRPMHEQSHFH